MGTCGDCCVRKPLNSFRTQARDVRVRTSGRRRKVQHVEVVFKHEHVEASKRYWVTVEYHLIYDS